MKENGFTLKKGKKQTIPSRNYADDIALLANTPTQAEYLVHSLEQAAGGVGLDLNVHEILAEKICYKLFVIY